MRGRLGRRHDVHLASICVRGSNALGVNVNLLDDGVVNTLGLVSTMAAARSPACLNGVVVEMLKNKQAGILRASRALLGSTAECREPHGCLAQQHRTREKHNRPGERREANAARAERSNRYAEQVYWLEPVR